jgi:hypothetical protein
MLLKFHLAVSGTCVKYTIFALYIYYNYLINYISFNQF